MWWFFCLKSPVFDNYYLFLLSHIISVSLVVFTNATLVMSLLAGRVGLKNKTDFQWMEGWEQRRTPLICDRLAFEKT